MESTPIDWFQVDPHAHITSLGPGTPIETSGKTEEMWDTRGYIQNWYNPVSHEKYFGLSHDLPDVPGTYSFGSVRGISLREDVRAALPFLSGAQLDELALKSEQALSSVVPDNFSIINFILELIGVLTLKMKVVRRFSDLYGRMRNAYSKALERYRRQGFEEARCRWLAWNFAIKPFIKDLQALLCSVSRAERQLEWLRRRNNQVTHLTYRREDLQSSNDLPIEWDPASYTQTRFLLGILGASDSSVNGSYVIQVRTVHLEVHYIARSAVKIHLPKWLLDDNKGLAHLWSAMQGLYNPVYVIWEAIPFSWLVDYFLSYRSRLFQQIYDDNPFDRNISVLGYGHSFRIVARGDARVYRLGGTNPGVFHELGGWEYEFYTRSAGLPKGEAVYFRVPSNWYQWSMIAAVGIGMISTRRRKKIRR